VNDASIDDMKTMLKRYIVPLFDDKTSSLALVTSPLNAEATAKGLREQQREVTIAKALDEIFPE
jgi:hypothetical protein